MYIQAHVFSGWIAGNYLKTNARDRFFCMIAAGIPDFDGLGIIISQKMYYDYHHILGHNLLFGVIISLTMAFLSKNKIKCFILYLALFHLHILMDLIGSGECWTVAYLKPFSNYELYSDFNWELFSWQNIVINFATLTWVVALIISRERTPLEYIMPSFDKKLSNWVKSCFAKMRGNFSKAGSDN